MDTHTDDNEQSWGVHVNIADEAALALACPTWATSAQQQNWTKPGLVLWDHATHQITHLAPTNALDLLADLQAKDDWQQRGITVEEHFSRIHSPSPFLDARRHLINPMRLTPTQAQMLKQILEAHEAALRTVAAPILRRQEFAFHLAYAYRIRQKQEQRAATLDLSTRPLPWIHDPEQRIWTCDLVPNRVTVRLADQEPFWRGCLERPRRLKHESPLCVTFEKALSWGEQTLLAEAAKPPANQTVPTPHARLSLDTLTAAHRRRLKRYWIDPQALEPAHPTYRAVIYLDHVPIRREYRELSFGEKMLWNERYQTSSDLVRQLALDGQALNIDQIGTFNRITSLATYADAAIARERTTLLWERSTIAAAFQAGKVTKASYGIEEVEMMYRTWIGGYGVWHTGTSDRSAFLARRAFELTLVYALDVAGYRAAMPIFGPEDTDEHVLASMHERRLESPHIPPTTRAESARWLNEHQQSLAMNRAKRV